MNQPAEQSMAAIEQPEVATEAALEAHAPIKKLTFAEKLFERALNASPTLLHVADVVQYVVDQTQRLAGEILLLANAVKDLAHNVSFIAESQRAYGEAQRTHAAAIQQLQDVQHHIIHKLRANSLDMSMPDIDAGQSEAPEVEGGLPAKHKPN
jgi:hypothetical protein